jgi:hypothetical protein
MASASSGGAPGADANDLEDEMPGVMGFLRGVVGRGAADVLDCFIWAFTRAALRIWKPEMLPLMHRIRTDSGMVWSTYMCVSDMLALPVPKIKGFEFPGTPETRPELFRKLREVVAAEGPAGKPAGPKASSSHGSAGPAGKPAGSGPAGTPADQPGSSPPSPDVGLSAELVALFEQFTTVAEIQGSDLPMMQKRRATKYLVDREAKRVRTEMAVPVTPPDDNVAKIAETQAHSEEEFRKFEAMLDSESFSKNYDTPGTNDYQGQTPETYRGIPLLTHIAPNADDLVATNADLEKTVELLRHGVFHPQNLGVSLMGDSSLCFFNKFILQRF